MEIKCVYEKKRENRKIKYAYVYCIIYDCYENSDEDNT